MTAYCTLYVTFADRDSAEAMARHLLTEKLIACANIQPPMTSLYVWDGAVCSESEQAVLMKTRKDKAPQAIEQIRMQHAYDTPCIVQWDITGGHGAYFDWIDACLKS